MYRIASGIGTCSTEGDEEAGVRHLLLFVSALIPKAFASLMTSVVVELSKPENVYMAHTHYQHLNSARI